MEEAEVTLYKHSFLKQEISIGHYLHVDCRETDLTQQTKSEVSINSLNTLH